jgi:hypothetical protein
MAQQQTELQSANHRLRLKVFDFWQYFIRIPATVLLLCICWLQLERKYSRVMSPFLLPGVLPFLDST